MGIQTSIVVPVFNSSPTIIELVKEISKLEKSMQTSARNLEFEKAAKIRDQVKYLKEKIYGANIKDRI